MSDRSTELPEPFSPDLWPRRLRAAVEALWDFHRMLAANPYQEKSEQIAAQLAGGNVPAGIPDRPTVEAAVAASREHGLPLDLMAAQVRASARFGNTLQFETVQDLWDFADAWAGSHALLLAHLADAAHTWQKPMVIELARGFFLTSRLAVLKHDLARRRVYIPAAEIDYAGLDVQALEAGRVDERMRRLMWKQIVRARDALARGEPLAQELEGKVRSAFKKSWLGALEVLGEIERRDYDLWSAPVALNRRQRVQVWYQSKFGRTTFRSK